MRSSTDGSSRLMRSSGGAPPSDRASASHHTSNSALSLSHSLASGGGIGRQDTLPHHQHLQHRDMDAASDIHKPVDPADYEAVEYATKMYLGNVKTVICGPLVSLSLHHHHHLHLHEPVILTYSQLDPQPRYCCRVPESFGVNAELMQRASSRRAAKLSRSWRRIWYCAPVSRPNVFSFPVPNHIRISQCLTPLSTHTRAEVYASLQGLWQRQPRALLRL